ncbi:hypothetical protein SODALDRAFT_34758 [Sodiomyces alkalinus F11]|uniref:Uncharacterized protein n=1 Tax=Sodiomyces alkalinus (strain CBS 110278 / VKM F-3762 / F11) TaxID=1314773 RepID=A0A3N2Q980_SODAK|nr:hypothetical protein SODALDRAFT_34758 [Sodiomyces alkalinus F11]ROT43257.1 hypothetical protein SODALDRAFT_34758 [Sodiomyces alkalinus F11]
MNSTHLRNWKTLRCKRDVMHLCLLSSTRIPGVWYSRKAMLRGLTSADLCDPREIGSRLSSAFHRLAASLPKDTTTMELGMAPVFR